MNTLPAERDMPPAVRAAARARAVAAVSEGWPGRRVVPIAAAVAVGAVVVGAVVASDHWAAGTRTPTSPASASAPARASAPASVAPRPSGSPPAPLTVAPPTAADRRRCFVPDTFRYVTGYRDSEATTWLFLRAAAKQSIACITLAGRSGKFAWFPNEWFDEGMAPAPDGHLTVTSDSTNALPSGWRVLVGTVPAATRKVLVEGPDGQRRAALAASWYVFHFHDGGRNRSVYAYDADDDLLASGHLF